MCGSEGRIRRALGKRDGLRTLRARSSKAIQARAAREAYLGFSERTLSASRFDLRRLSSTAMTGAARTLTRVSCFPFLAENGVVLALSRREVFDGPTTRAPCFACRTDERPLTLLDCDDRPTDADAGAFLWVPRGFVGAAP